MLDKSLQWLSFPFMKLPFYLKCSDKFAKKKKNSEDVFSLFCSSSDGTVILFRRLLSMSAQIIVKNS